MYLKRIEVSGFKSFANRINLDFTSGITCIVGPNGSGKSNVADAVRWVLGEQSVKQLRGSSMQDVIFSGTQTRKPQGSAYVAITLDNADRSLNFDSDEVTVSRRLYRSGESEYKMNGADCRLRDIYELFYDTGIGKEGYSIIGQGQIDRIVSGKPEERRELLDEAAGIVKFKKRKLLTVKKLESEEANLVRVRDILSELEKQVGPLEKQSQKAKAYLQLRDQLKELDVKHFMQESASYEAKMTVTQDNVRIVADQLEEARATAEQWKDQYESMMAAAAELNRQIEACQANAHQAVVQKENLEGRMKVLQEQIHTEEINDEHYGSRLHALADQIAAHQAEQEALSRQKAELDTQLAALQQERDAEERELHRLDREIRQLEAGIEDGKQGIINALNERADVSAKVQRYDTLLEQSTARQAQVSAQLLHLKTEQETCAAQLAEQKKERDALKQRWENIDKEGHRTADQLGQLERQIQDGRRDLTDSERQVQTVSARLESLRNLAERYEGYGNSVRRIMEVKNRYPGVVGVVADLIQADQKYEIAIETALGGSIQNIVTETETCAKNLISYLKENRYGRATFLPMESIKSMGEFRETGALREPGAIGLADSLVTVKGCSSALSKYLLGRVLVVDHIDHALAIARKYRYTIRMVTLEGELLNAGGSLTGGAFKNNSNLLGRKRELEELEAGLQKARARRASCQTSLNELLARENTEKARLTELTAQAGDYHVKWNTADLNTRQAEARQEELHTSYEELKQEARQLEEQKRQIEDSRKSLQQETSQIEDKNLQAEDTVRARTVELEQRKQEREARSEAFSQVQLSYQTLSQKEQFLTENQSRLSREIAAGREESAEIEKGIRQSHTSVAEKQAQITALAQELARLEESRRQTEEETASLTARREQDSASQKEFIDRREALLEEVSRLDKEAYRLDGQVEKLKEQQEALLNHLWEEYEMTPVAAREMCPLQEIQESAAEIRSRIQELKKQIKELGDVNVNAIQEYKEVFERYSFLQSQHQDLIQAKESLEGIIAELDEGMRRQFTTEFAEIQKEFNQVFKELFGGGQGTLSLVEGEDILTAGVQINAQPPGKKLQNMMQLSGGEKALTAISLLFAIQNRKPSPFCLLDEIEAALDDPNVDRFAGYLSNLTDHTQFILITHRRGTMLRGDRLYGITMQEKGVSTLVSVDLTDDAV